jgi:superfamily II DNA or RNA helicase
MSVTLRPVQEQAITHIYERNESLVFARPGAGKTVVTLTALSEMLADGIVRRVLVTAPLRVAELVWQQEGEKWEHLQHRPSATRLSREPTSSS